MRRFLKDTSGNAVISAAFIILIFCTLAFVIYSGVTVSNKYQAAETELQRAVTVAIDTCMINSNVRDVDLDIPATSAESVLKDTLTESGWTIADSGSWVKQYEDKLVYRLDDVEINIDDKTMRLDSDFVTPLPWTIGGLTEVKIPMQIRESIQYIDE
jgi:Flp pilus assembly protein TadG